MNLPPIYLGSNFRKVDASTSPEAKDAASRMYRIRLNQELKTGASLSDADGEAWEAVCDRFSGIDYSEVIGR